jgi:hypothetical protein
MIVICKQYTQSSFFVKVYEDYFNAIIAASCKPLFFLCRLKNLICSNTIHWRGGRHSVLLFIKFDLVLKYCADVCATHVFAKHL